MSASHTQNEGYSNSLACLTDVLAFILRYRPKLSAHAHALVACVLYALCSSGCPSIINPRRACAARVTLSVCLSVCMSVCLSVDDYSRTTGYEAAYERYQQLQCYKGMKINVVILLKRLRSRDMA